MNSVLLRSLLVGISLVFAISCGGDASFSPTAPSRSGVAGQTGAVIVGQVNSPSAPVTRRSAVGMLATAGTFATADAASVTVKVVGTNISTTTNGQGQFTLTGVPPGEVRLEFTGPGGSATISISGVRADEEIRISITLNGTNARVDSERRNNRDANNGQDQSNEDEDEDDDDDEDDDRERDTRSATQAEVKGAVSGFTGTCPTVSFMFRGTTTKVNTNETTRFEDIRCAAIKDGTVVEVTGTRQSDGSIMATKVEGDD